jgi:hypothetical protein
MKNNKVVAIIKHNGIILCENNNEIKIPFDSEYTILIKNLENKKIKIKVSIDNKYIVNDMIINNNSKIELKKIFKNKNEYELIKIEFQYEKDKPIVNTSLNKNTNNKSNYISHLTNAINELNPSNKNIILKDPIKNKEPEFKPIIDFENELNLITLQLKGFLESTIKPNIKSNITSNTTIIDPIKRTIAIFSQKVCPNCGMKNGRLDRHCFECGTPLKYL